MCQQMRRWVCAGSQDCLCLNKVRVLVALKIIQASDKYSNSRSPQCVYCFQMIDTDQNLGMHFYLYVLSR